MNPMSPPPAAPEDAGKSSTEGRGAFGGFVGPRTLAGLVRQTVPFLFDTPLATPPRARLHELAFDPLGWKAIVQQADRLAPNPAPGAADLTDYFALCLAAHFATVASYVPTDVDTKIRHALWMAQTDSAERERMYEVALASAAWDVRSVSARLIPLRTDATAAHEFLSGHDGERLSVWAGALAAAARREENAWQARFMEAIAAELEREAAAYRDLEITRGRDLDWLRAAAVLTHNAGDVNQGLLVHARGRPEPAVQRFARLAQEDGSRFGGTFADAAAVYRAVLAPEGHRNYPLRAARGLRTHAALLLPIAPFLDDWGARLARWEPWDDAVRAEAVAAVVEGCRVVAGQAGYYRALAGFAAAFPGGVEAPRLWSHYPSAVRRTLRTPELRQRVAVAERSFTSACVKRARAAVWTAR
jgi:hypothetical protein